MQSGPAIQGASVGIRAPAEEPERELALAIPRHSAERFREQGREGLLPDQVHVHPRLQHGFDDGEPILAAAGPMQRGATAVQRIRVRARVQQGVHRSQIPASRRDVQGCGAAVVGHVDVRAPGQQCGGNGKIAGLRRHMPGCGSVVVASIGLRAGDQQQRDGGRIRKRGGMVENGMPTRVPRRHIGSRLHALRIGRRDRIGEGSVAVEPVVCARRQRHSDEDLQVPVPAAARAGESAAVVARGGVGTCRQQLGSRAGVQEGVMAGRMVGTQVAPGQVERGVAADIARADIGTALQQRRDRGTSVNAEGNEGDYVGSIGLLRPHPVRSVVQRCAPEPVAGADVDPGRKKIPNEGFLPGPGRVVQRGPAQLVHARMGILARRQAVWHRLPLGEVEELVRAPVFAGVFRGSGGGGIRGLGSRAGPGGLGAPDGRRGGAGEEQRSCQRGISVPESHLLAFSSQWAKPPEHRERRGAGLAGRKYRESRQEAT